LPKVEAKMMELPSGEKKPQVFRDGSPLMRVGFPAPVIRSASQMSGATYSWYSVFPLGNA
jgi:hypothetical protein